MIVGGIYVAIVHSGIRWMIEIILFVWIVKLYMKNKTMEGEMQEMKPCAKCGSDNVTLISPMVAIYHGCCLNCDSMSISGYYKQEAIENWNRKQNNGGKDGN
jgi:hypothetical protein